MQMLNKNNEVEKVKRKIYKSGQGHKEYIVYLSSKYIKINYIIYYNIVKTEYKLFEEITQEKLNKLLK